MCGFTVNPSELADAVERIGQAVDETGVIGDKIAAVGGSDYGAILSGAVAIAEPFTTQKLQEVFDSLGAYAGDVTSRLRQTANDYMAVETANAQAAQQIVNAIDARF